MVSDDYNKGLVKFRKDMKRAGESLPKNWVQIILKKKMILSVIEYQKIYNTLVNFRSGRSYRSALKQPELAREIIELSDKYKKLKL